MTDPSQDLPFAIVIRPLVKLLTVIAAWTLSAMMFLTFVDVVLRYLFNRPIPGAAEVIQYMMAIVVPFSIVYCARKQTHITVELLVERLSTKARQKIDCLISLMMFVFFVPITWQSFYYILDEYQSGLTSSVLYIPVYPFIGAVAVSFAVLTLLLFAQFVANLHKVVTQWTRSSSA
jgi:TRAP-type transport system small permease protein